MTYRWSKPSAWKRIRAAILVRDAGICWICGRDGANSVDHVLPMSRGGSSEEGNLRAAHMYCNLMRTRHMKRGRRREQPVLPRARTSRWA